MLGLGRRYPKRPVCQSAGPWFEPRPGSHSFWQNRHPGSPADLPDSVAQDRIAPMTSNLQCPRCGTVNGLAGEFCAQCGAGCPSPVPRADSRTRLARISAAAVAFATRRSGVRRRHAARPCGRGTPPGAPAAATARDRRRRTPPGDRRLRRPRRLHADVASARPRGRPCDARAVLRGGRRDRRALRRQRRQAYRRFGDGGVRRSGRARRRCAARRARRRRRSIARCPRSAAPRASRWRCMSASPRARSSPAAWAARGIARTR